MAIGASTKPYDASDASIGFAPELTAINFTALPSPSRGNCLTRAVSILNERRRMPRHKVRLAEILAGMQGSAYPALSTSKGKNAFRPEQGTTGEIGTPNQDAPSGRSGAFRWARIFLRRVSLGFEPHYEVGTVNITLSISRVEPT